MKPHCLPAEGYDTAVTMPKYYERSGLYYEGGDHEIFGRNPQLINAKTDNDRALGQVFTENCPSLSNELTSETMNTR
jgi:hypothetical protein